MHSIVSSPGLSYADLFHFKNPSTNIELVRRKEKELLPLKTGYFHVEQFLLQLIFRVTADSTKAGGYRPENKNQFRESKITSFM